MILDSSAILAILKKEPEWLTFAKLIDSTDHTFVSAASYLEAAIVLDRERNSIVSASLDELISEAQIEIEPVTAEQASLAR